ncbi:MAG: MmgE/PrpD family protein [Paracoccaceae bacterium]|nr:MAG: MmgE/PrpD family protein [Paracoccaceae bacterium]
MTAQPTKDLAAFFAGMTREGIPPIVREQVTDIILDTVASAIAGRLGDETGQIETLASAVGGPATSTVIAGPANSLAGATLVNGYQVTAVTVCDIHRPTLCHVTPEVIPPALAYAEAHHCSGRDFLVAVTAGLESVVRVGTGMNYPAMRANGWHSPGVIGPFGGAAAVGRLMGLDAARMQNALSLAGTQSAGTFAHWGTPTIKFHQSRGALSGLMAALLAQTGFKAGPEVLTAAHGGLFHLYSDGGNPAAAVAGLGETWMLDTISLRLWPAASSIQSVITAMFALIEAHDLTPDQVDQVEVGLSKTVHDMHGTLPWDNKFRALLSTPYVVGVVLHDRACWFEQFRPERITDPDLDAFIRARVRVGIDETVKGTGAAVTIRTRDGRSLTDRRDHPRGDAADRLTRAEIVDKFRRSATGLLSHDNTERAIAMLIDIENLPDMAELCAVLAAPKSA